MGDGGSLAALELLVDVWKHKVWYFRFKRFGWQNIVWGPWW